MSKVGRIICTTSWTPMCTILAHSICSHKVNNTPEQSSRVAFSSMLSDPSILLMYCLRCTSILMFSPGPQDRSVSVHIVSIPLHCSFMYDPIIRWAHCLESQNFITSHETYIAPTSFSITMSD